LTQNGKKRSQYIIIFYFGVSTRFCFRDEINCE